MARTRQQVSGASSTINVQMHNGRQSAIDEVEEQARWLFNIEQNVDTMRATIKRVEATMMRMEQSLRAQPQ